MNPRAFKQMLVGSLVLPLLCLSYFTQRSLNRDRAELELTENAPLENAPPALAFTTVALGGFRGMIANALWIRASDLKEQEKFFELIQLAHWIGQLQPRFSDVWSFQAWNLAYNVSVKFPDDESRWKWVREGISLLRDEGLRYNPDKAELYHHLGHIFRHKLADSQDSAHNYYKRMWKDEMETILGPLYATPTPDWDELIKPSSPESRERDRRLREVYKLDPEAMKAVDDEYGPLEWRLPESHAIYWAWFGLNYAHGSRLIDLRRVVYHGLQTAVRRGHIVEYVDGVYEYLPNLRLLDSANKAYLDMRQQDTAVKSNIATAHGNFLLHAITLLDGTGMQKLARRYFDYVKKEMPQVAKEYEDYDDLIHKRLVEDITRGGHEKIQPVLLKLMTRRVDRMVQGEVERADHLKALADRIHKAYYERYRHADRDRIKIPEMDHLWNRALEIRIANPPPIGYPDHLAAKFCGMTGLDFPAALRAQNLPTEVSAIIRSYNNDGTPEENLKQGIDFLSAVSQEAGILKTRSGLLIKIHKTGAGKRVKDNSRVRAHVVGRLINGSIGEATYEMKERPDFDLKARPRGVQEGMIGMREGGRRTLYVPSELAYGQQGQSPNYPPNSVVIFDIELIRVLD